MEWKHDYRVGIVDIDEQHQEIARCIAGIKASAARQDLWSVLHAGLASLAHLSRIHFELEESLMRIHGFPDLDEHVVQHQQFAADLKELRESALASNVLHVSIHALHRWWDEHIREHDRPYAFHVRRRTAAGKS